MSHVTVHDLIIYQQVCQPDDFFGHKISNYFSCRAVYSLTDVCKWIKQFSIMEQYWVDRGTLGQWDNVSQLLKISLPVSSRWSLFVTFRNICCWWQIVLTYLTGWDRSGCSTHPGHTEQSLKIEQIQAQKYRLTDGKGLLWCGNT